MPCRIQPGGPGVAARRRRIAGRLEYLKRRREDSCSPARLVLEIRQSAVTPSGRRSFMSEDRFEQEEPKDEDVEAHRRHGPGRDVPATDELDSDDSDDVEAHRRKSLTDDLQES